MSSLEWNFDDEDDCLSFPYWALTMSQVVYIGISYKNPTAFWWEKPKHSELSDFQST